MGDISIMVKPFPLSFLSLTPKDLFVLLEAPTVLSADLDRHLDSCLFLDPCSSLLSSCRAAKCYEDGLGTRRDKTKAAQYYR